MRACVCFNSLLEKREWCAAGASIWKLQKISIEMVSNIQYWYISVLTALLEAQCDEWSLIERCALIISFGHLSGAADIQMDNNI